MKILVTGAGGQLGQEIRKIATAYPYQFVFTSRKDLDLEDMPHLSDFIRYGEFDWIINCAAYTAVDKAEEEPNKARLINTEAVFNMVQAAEWIGAKFIHFSTDYVFDGTKTTPYTEEDAINPLSVYAKTKAEGEKFVLNYSFGMVIRSSWLYSSIGHNFVKTMLRLAKEKKSLSVVFDQVGTPTYAADLAELVMNIILQHEEKKVLFPPGLYHYSNEGVASWYDFAHAIFELTNTKIDLFPIRTAEFPRPAQRPSYSVLDKSKIKNLYNLKIPHWTESLKRMLSLL